MTPEILDIPDDAESLAPWLEKQLMGLRLQSIISQIQLIIHSVNSNQDESLEEILGAQLESVLNNGLRNLPKPTLRRLVANPTSLLSLQELVLEHGGDYWQSIELTPTHLEMQSRVRAKLVSAGGELLPDGPLSATDSLPSITLAKPVSQTSRNWIYVGLLGLAAAILVMAFQPWATRNQGEFFASNAIQTSQLRGRDFLKLMASEIERDWSQSTDRDFRAKLVALRDSCQVLLNSSLPQLDASIAQEVKTRCQKWQADFTLAIEDLDQGTNVAEIEARVNGSIQKLTTFLRS